ncbi:MAG: FAD-dependent monooxygenase [Deltaproteobacteria bacterium]|nr:FAD-dependent monooxygenase [Deltaproteobacteria bacterium]
MGRYEAIIVGGGFAGLACASIMPGRRIVLLERHASVVEQHRGCLGLWIQAGQGLEIQAEDVFLPGIGLLVEGGVLGRLGRIEITGQRERVVLPLGRPLTVLNRSRIKSALLKRVQDSGVEVRVEAPVREVHAGGREVRVRADEDHVGRILVGADGANSLVARSLPLRRQELAVIFEREAEVDRLDLPPETLHIQVDDIRNLFFAYAAGGRFLASVIQVVGPRGVPSDLDARLDDRIERLGAGRRLVARSAIARMSEPSPISYRDNVVLTGDALAAYGLATISGALCMGALAGRSVNRFLAGSRYALPDYHQRWRQQTRQSLIEKLRWILPLVDRIHGDRADRMIRALRGSGGGPVSSVWWRLPHVLARLFV